MCRFCYLVLFSAFLFTLLFGSAYADNSGFISAEVANFRKEPNGEIIETYSNGKPVLIVSVEGDWTCCIIDGMTGYVFSDFIQADSVEETPEPIETYIPETPQGSVYIEPTQTPTPTEEPEPTEQPQEASPLPSSSPAPVIVSAPQATVKPITDIEIKDAVKSALQEMITPTPEPTPSPEPEPTEYEITSINILGNIQGYLIFFVVCILLWGCYKFLRIFF